MFKVNNRKLLTTLSLRSLKAAKQRNIIAIFAIMLTSVLFTTLFTLGIGSLDAFQQATMRQSGGSAHAAVKYIDDPVFEQISAHSLVKEISYNRILCDSVDNEALLKRRGELWYMDENGLKQGFCQPTVGKSPVVANEIITDTKTLQLLKVPLEIGAEIKLKITIRGQQVERDFVLSGWWESDPAYNVSMLITSKAYVDAHLSELSNTYKEDSSLTGAVNAYILFGNTFNMQQKLDRIITECGYDPVNKESPHYLESNLNWAYLSASMSVGDPIAVTAFIGAALLILFTGYLIIYNIFHLSVLRDIRYYGLLKTIGATGRQIKRIIRRQAAVLSLVGLPLGLLAGYAVGSQLVPQILSVSFYAGSTVSLSPNPLIFLGAALFAILTVWISTHKPGKIAASVSPVEAVRYIGVETDNRKKEKHSSNGGKVYKMAFYNVGRHKKRTLLVLVSLSLSLVLLNCVFTLSRGLDMDKYLSTFVDTDFLAAHVDYFNNGYHSGINAVEEQMIADIERQPEFLEGGCLYSTSWEYFTVEDSLYDKAYNRGEDGHPVAAVYGLDDLPLARLEVVAGEIDVEKLQSGGYILEGVHTDDFGRPMGASSFEIGDTVTLHNKRMLSVDPPQTAYTTQTYEIMAKVIIKQYTNADRRWNTYSFYLPASIYLPLTYEKAVMSYVFNVADGTEAAMEAFLKNYTETLAPLMNYESKAIKQKEFESMGVLILSVGGILSGIIGLIGLLNFINALLTSIIARRREFAMLESIGMTQKQLRNMLCLEGLYYAGGTILLSLALGILTSLLVVRNLMGGLWFASYHFVIAPLIVCWPFFILFSLIIPLIALKGNLKESVVERLRETE